MQFLEGTSFDLKLNFELPKNQSFKKVFLEKKKKIGSPLYIRKS
jgi:hypothetical protein